MTKMLEQVFEKVSKLPQDEQDAMAAFMIEELERAYRPEKLRRRQGHPAVDSGLGFR